MVLTIVYPRNRLTAVGIFPQGMILSIESGVHRPVFNAVVALGKDKVNSLLPGYTGRLQWF